MVPLCHGWTAAAARWPPESVLSNARHGGQDLAVNRGAPRVAGRPPALQRPHASPHASPPLGAGRSAVPQGWDP